MGWTIIKWKIHLIPLTWTISGLHKYKYFYYNIFFQFFLLFYRLYKYNFIWVLWDVLPVRWSSVILCFYLVQDSDGFTAHCFQANATIWFLSSRFIGRHLFYVCLFVFSFVFFVAIQLIFVGRIHYPIGEIEYRFMTSIRWHANREIVWASNEAEKCAIEFVWACIFSKAGWSAFLSTEFDGKTEDYIKARTICARVWLDYYYEYTAISVLA